MRIPTVGRIVHVNLCGNKGQPYPAIITHVWSMTCVNLMVIDDGSYPAQLNGPLMMTSVTLAVDASDVNRWHWPAQVESQ